METIANQFPLYCLPPLHFFKKFTMLDEQIIELGEGFEKQSHRSRFDIAGPNGRQTLSIPLIHKSCHKTMADVQIDYSSKWNQKHWRSIETAYNKAPFFEFYAHYFEPLFIKKYVLLAEWNLEAFTSCLKIIKLKQIFVINTLPKHTIQPNQHFEPITYNQVFIKKNGFLPNLSIMDLIFNEGPLAKDYF